jgi:signal transduction histidine kinase
VTEMRELAPELRAVHDLARAAQGAYEVRDLMDRICTSVAETFGFERVAISRYHEDADEIQLLAAYGLPVERVRELPRAVSEWPVYRKVLETKAIVFVDDVQDQTALPAGVAEEYDAKSVVAVPLISQECCLGFLSADKGGTPFRLDETAQGILETIGVLAASFVEKALVHQELTRLDKVKTNFIALASHELRTPATVIYGISSTLNQRADDLRDDQIRDLRKALFDQSERMRQLVDQLLDLSRLEARAITIEPEKFSVRRRVEELIFVLAPERANEVELDVEQELETTADVGAFDRIVSNLITNAFRYGAPPIKVSAEQRDRHFRLSVEDRGRGVNPEFVPQLFERFTRSPHSATSMEGAGLGLSIAQSFAQAHGGDLIYHPAKPTGARFDLVLPRSGY